MFSTAVFFAAALSANHLACGAPLPTTTAAAPPPTMRAAQPIWSILHGRFCVDATDDVDANCEGRLRDEDIADAITDGGVNMLEFDVNRIVIGGGGGESTFIVHHRPDYFDHKDFGCHLDATTGELIETRYCTRLTPFLKGVVAAHPQLHGLWADVKINLPGPDLARLISEIRAAVGDVNVLYELTSTFDIEAKSHIMAASADRELDAFCSTRYGTLAQIPLYTGVGVHGNLTLAMCPDLNPASASCLCEDSELMVGTHDGAVTDDSDGNPRAVAKVFPFAFMNGGKVDKYMTRSGIAAAGLDFHLDGMLYDYPKQLGDFQRIREVVDADPALRVAVRSDRFNVKSEHIDLLAPTTTSETAGTAETTVIWGLSTAAVAAIAAGCGLLLLVVSVLVGRWAVVKQASTDDAAAGPPFP
jgi:hypothetical protein